MKHPTVMKSMYEIKVSNAALVFALYILIGMYSCAHAQAIQRICQKGYEMSYGFHNFKPRKAGEHNANVAPAARGIALGGFAGNNLLKIRVRGLGFYEANTFFKDDYYQYEAEVLSNFSPLEFFRVSKNAIDIYLITGLNYTHINFDNHVSIYNRKRFDRLSRVAGLGAEYIVRKGSKTIYIFSEATLGNPLKDAKENGKTPLPSVLSAFNFGVRVGYSKTIKIKPGF